MTGEEQAFGKGSGDVSWPVLIVGGVVVLDVIAVLQSVGRHVDQLLDGGDGGDLLARSRRGKIEALDGWSRR